MPLDQSVLRRLSDVILEQQPLTLRASATILEACQKMREYKAGSVLVVDGNGRLAGIFTGRDAVCRVLASGAEPNKSTLANVMTLNPQTLSPEASTIDA